MYRAFEHEGKISEVRVKALDERYAVKVFLNNKLVSPEYSATLEVGVDIFVQHKSRLIDELVKIVENDVRNGIYFKA